MSLTEPIIVTLCPDCETEIKYRVRPKLGAKVTCPECWAYLEVLSLEPLTLGWEIEEEDFSADLDEEFDNDFAFETEGETEDWSDDDQDWGDEDA